MQPAGVPQGPELGLQLLDYFDSRKSRQAFRVLLDFLCSSRHHFLDKNMMSGVNSKSLHVAENQKSSLH